MEQVPHWLEAAVTAAGMTAYAEEVEHGARRAHVIDAHFVPAVPAVSPQQ